MYTVKVSHYYSLERRIVLPRRTKEEAEDTRAKILDAALDIFSEKNYSNVSIVEIADKVGMTKGAVYWHFKNKNDILVKLLEDTSKRHERDFMDIYGAPNTVDELRNYDEESLRLPYVSKKYMKVHKLMLRRHEWPEDLRNRVDKLARDSVERERKMLEELIVKGQELGKIRADVSPNEIALLLSSVFQGLFILQMVEILPPDFYKHMDFLFNAFTRELNYKGNRTVGRA